VAKQATAMRTRRGRRAVAPIEAERGSESSSDLTAAEGIVVYCSGGGVGNSRRGVRRCFGAGRCQGRGPT
jgi:hypothetical protein